MTDGFSFELDRKRRIQPLVLSLKVRRLLTSLVQEELCQAQVPLLPGNLIKLDQSQFYLRMPRGPVSFARTENAVNIVSQSNGHIEQVIFAGRLVVADGSLK